MGSKPTAPGAPKMGSRPRRPDSAKPAPSAKLRASAGPKKPLVNGGPNRKGTGKAGSGAGAKVTITSPSTPRAGDQRVQTNPGKRVQTNPGKRVQTNNRKSTRGS